MPHYSIYNWHLQLVISFMYVIVIPIPGFRAITCMSSRHAVISVSALQSPAFGAIFVCTIAVTRPWSFVGCSTAAVGKPWCYCCVHCCSFQPAVLLTRVRFQPHAVLLYCVLLQSPVRGASVVFICATVDARLPPKFAV